MPHAADRIRNVALVGHRGSGKTSLHEALLFEAGATTRLGSVADGTTVSDADEDEKARGDVDLRVARLVRVARREGQPDRHARRAVASSPTRSAPCACASPPIFVVNGVMGVEVSHAAAVGARAGARRRAAGLREHARPRAGRLLPRARRRSRRPSGRTSWRPRSRSAPSTSSRGVIDLVDMKAYEYARRQLHGDPDPGRPRRPRAGVPREADGRGRRELRGADGALPRGRGDLPRRDRHRARGRHRPRPHLPGHLRRGDHAAWAPTACSTRSSTTCPRRSSTAALEVERT